MAQLPRNLHLVFAYLNENSESLNKRDFFQDPTKEDETLRIWRGKGKDIAEATGIKSQNVYRNISTLSIMGCIVKIRHGSRDVPTVYQILKEPDQHEYLLLLERNIMSEKLELPGKADRAQDSVNRLISRINDLERRVRFLEGK